jgi:asparagine synthase (glutamine-hydrolysing)
MCGVAALLGPIPPPAREELVREMCTLLAHRGPDGQGILSPPPFSAGNAGVTLGHRRLAILDLSPAAAQPMSCGPLHISYNGEFYNYLEKRANLEASDPAIPWRSHGDTEVLLRLIERQGLPDALAEVNGMFAFALWDEQKRCLWLARDRFGEKPLYYLLDGNRHICIVASEIKAVLQAARRLQLPIAVRRSVLACYLADADYEVGDASFFTSIRRVRPGELLRIEVLPDGKLQRKSQNYYEISPELCTPSSGAAADERFAELLSDSLRLRLRSDVPVGACLSGGLDSSSLVCLAQRILQPLDGSLRTFSAVYQPQDPCDERRYVAAVIEHSGVQNAQAHPEAALRPDAFAAFLSQHDEPVGGASVWAQHAVYRLVAEQGVRVAISGQGADECLTGYRGTMPAVHAALLRQGRWPGLAGLLPGLRTLARGLSPKGLYRAWLHLRWYAAFADTPFFRLSALGPPPPLTRPPPHLQAFFRRSPLHGYLYSLLCGSSLGTILRYEDRNSMSASVEARAPFLDPRVVEHCLGRPAEELATPSASSLPSASGTKALLRRTLGPLLPPLVRQRQDKIGFAAPESRWLLGPLRPLVLEVLHSPNHQAESRELFDWQALRSHYAQALCGQPFQSYSFWKALNVALWLRQHSLSL